MLCPQYLWGEWLGICDLISCILATYTHLLQSGRSNSPNLIPHRDLRFPVSKDIPLSSVRSPALIFMCESHKAFH